MASRISKDGLWRVTYGEPNGYTRDELIARQPEKFRAMLPGNPTPDKYTLANISPYKVHQRLAESMRVGRFLLAADAAHICNPMGGLGLTGGIVDIGGLYDCLLGIHEGKAGEEILSTYSDVRRAKYLEFVDPISTANLLRLFKADPETVMETDEFFKMCKKAETDLKFSKEMQNVSFIIPRLDMKQPLMVHLVHEYYQLRFYRALYRRAEIQGYTLDIEWCQFFELADM